MNGLSKEGKMKVLVTGGGGYIGCVVVKELLHRGYSVKVFDKFYFGKEPLSDLEKRIEIVQGDIREFDPEILNDVEAVVHLAAFSNDPMAEFNPKANFKINALGTEKIGQACVEKGIRRLTYASTASIYDRGLFAGDELQDENSKVEPRASYAVSKYIGEQKLLELGDKNKDFCPVILRQGTVYGYSPRMRYDLVVNTFVKSAFTTGRLTVFCGGRMWRPLVDVKDVARAHITCLEAPEEKVKNQIFNVAYGNYQIIDLAHRVKTALKGIVDVEVDVDYDTERIERSYKISNKKIENILGFRHQIPPEEAAIDMAKKIKEEKHSDFDNPIYYNIKWFELLKEFEDRIRAMGGVF